MGGEKVTHNTDRKSKAGSPPHGRGKGTGAFTGFGFGRITPAWAGKSLSDDHLRIAFKDHPRMGGEKNLTVTAS